MDKHYCNYINVVNNLVFRKMKIRICQINEISARFYQIFIDEKLE